MIPNLLSKVLFKDGYNVISGILPVYKPPGMCCICMTDALRLDLYFVLDRQNLDHGVLLVDNAMFLEPFAKGLVTFLIGPNIYNKRNFALANYVHETVVEFGVQRHHGCIDGQVMSKVPIHNVTAESIKQALPKFINSTSQKRWYGYRANPDNNRDPLTSLNSPDSQISQDVNVNDYYNQMILRPIRDKSSRIEQKYPFIQPDRPTKVESIELLDYRAPFARFRISSAGCFGARQFAVDLAEILDTKASLVELTRRKEGPIVLEDLRVFQPYEMNLEYYSSRWSSIEDTYNEFNEEHDKLWERPSSRRRIIS